MSTLRRSFSGAILIWVSALVSEAIAYQGSRLLSDLIASELFFSVLLRYMSFRALYSIVPIIIAALLIHALKPKMVWAYLLLMIAAISSALYFTFASGSTQFDPSIIWYCLLSYGLLFTADLLLTPLIRRAAAYIHLI